MKVVINTSPLIVLFKINLTDLLLQLFTEIIVRNPRSYTISETKQDYFICVRFHYSSSKFWSVVISRFNSIYETKSRRIVKYINRINVTQLT